MKNRTNKTEQRYIGPLHAEVDDFIESGLKIVASLLLSVIFVMMLQANVELFIGGNSVPSEKLMDLIAKITPKMSY